MFSELCTLRCTRYTEAVGHEADPGAPCLNSYAAPFANVPYCNTVVSHCACNFPPPPPILNDKMNFTRGILPGSSSPSHRESPGTEVVVGNLVPRACKMAKYFHKISEY